ncbi:uncharacterized protein LOC142803050 [Rhipicephalus microplus]|uniref:uncharacterized protein LOC142803050 n=1 Tax=Rhipicephalus microplus TaxID=6941 RepID=UPI003F6A998C
MFTTRSLWPTSTAHNTSEASGSMAATSPNALSTTTADIVTPAIHLPVVEVSASTMFEGVSPGMSMLYASCHQQPSSPSQSAAAKVKSQAVICIQPNFRDAATMTDAAEDDVPAVPMAEQTAHAAHAVEVVIDHEDPHANPHARTTDGRSTRAGVPPDTPAMPASSELHNPSPEHLAPDAARHAGWLVTTVTTRGTTSCLKPLTACPRNHHILYNTERPFFKLPAKQPCVEALAFEMAQAPRRFARRDGQPLAVHMTKRNARLCCIRRLGHLLRHSAAVSSGRRCSIDRDVRTSTISPLILVDSMLGTLCAVQDPAVAMTLQGHHECASILHTISPTSPAQALQARFSATSTRTGESVFE